MKNYRYFLSGFTSCLPVLLAGCALTPAYVTPATPAITLASPQQAQFSAVANADNWWTFFDDPRLSQLIASALEHNRDIAQAQANLLAARAVFDERRLDELPTVTAQAGWQRSVQQDTPASRASSSSTRAGFDAQWELDLFGRLAHITRSAQAQADAAQADLQQLQLTIAADVARNYYEALGHQQNLLLTQAQVQSWRDTVALIDARIRAGSGLPEERQNALANLTRSEAALPPLQAALRQAQYRLDVLSGRAPGAIALATSARQQAPLASQLPLGDVNQLIKHRPDVVRAERLLAASSEDVGAATAELYPRISLGGFLGFFALRGSSVFDGGARAFELAPTVNYPAFRLGSTRARVRGTQALAQGALARYEQTILLAQEDVENAVTQLVENQSRLASLLQSARHGSAALDIASTRYQGGAGSYQAVLENQRALYDIRRDALQAETASYVDAIALYKALGWGQTM
ncbi:MULTISPECIES: efflux transporter outer membrane subunit [unclassified Janthinobacterium]|uniref:efflux transporter outer membrane subunit n=1 Tax=unclassified Janthinobacterium TaxID=2610881 RepID=UPI00161C916E|nr:MULTISPECIES: TolC family protein [unclassified Janthinobacterium]MBB5371431.1 multidrug efflux system outer membrane protein [Janthinobacterium sp. K2C7]MBB5384237.1 multidrug efflux system outer membrane protein [Janthinobacterium sp. K2Li3]MBB5389512.1 multidrug efflux system outer membrane protein [Janthinobacterium sp. K2E3]